MNKFKICQPEQLMLKRSTMNYPAQATTYWCWKRMSGNWMITNSTAEEISSEYEGLPSRMVTVRQQSLTLFDQVTAMKQVNGESQNLTPPPPRPNPVSDRNTNRHRWLRRGPLHLCNGSSGSCHFQFTYCLNIIFTSNKIWWWWLCEQRAQNHYMTARCPASVTSQSPV